MSLFDKRENILPYEYPELLEYMKAIQQSYWLVDEFNYDGDKQNYLSDLKEIPFQKNLIKKAMLAISQIEVNVKTFWGRLDMLFPKLEISLVGSVFGDSECHVEGTEVLTPNGWLDFRYLKEGDLVMQYNQGGTMNFAPCSNIVNRAHNGPMYRFFKKGWECIVTPGHRMVYYKENGEFVEELAESFMPNSDKKIPYAGFALGNYISLTAIERLMIAIQADGAHRYWVNTRTGERKHRGARKNCWTYEIAIKKDRKKDRLFYLLSQLPEIEYRVFNVEREGYIKVEIDMPEGLECKDFNWVNLSGRGYIWAQEFVEELMEWDGYRIPYKVDCQRRYSTTNKSCADMVQAIGAMAGYYCTMNVYNDPRSPNFNTVYTISFLTNRNAVGLSGNHKQEFQYVGNVYCCEVPSGVLLTRYNNCTTISGNCRHFEAYKRLLEILGLNEEFTRINEIPALQKRVEYTTKFVENKALNNEETILSVVLFSMFIEHISLFSQFLILMSFNYYKNMFKGISNAVEATSKEEEIHGKFGIALYEILRRERPEFFTEAFFNRLESMADEAFKAEMEIVDWMYESETGEDLDFLPKRVVINYIKNRYNRSYKALGLEPKYVVDQDDYKYVEWFDIEVVAIKENDFFNKRNVDYAKGTQGQTGDDLF